MNTHQTPTLYIFQDNPAFQASVSMLTKRHRENGEVIPREEVQRALWIWLDRSIDLLIEDAAQLATTTHPHGFNDDDYEPQEIETWYATQEAAREAAQFIADTLLVPAHVMDATSHPYKGKSWNVLNDWELSARRENADDPRWLNSYTPAHLTPIFTVQPTTGEKAS